MAVTGMDSDRIPQTLIATVDARRVQVVIVETLYDGENEVVPHLLLRFLRRVFY